MHVGIPSNQHSIILSSSSLGNAIRGIKLSRILRSGIAPGGSSANIFTRVIFLKAINQIKLFPCSNDFLFAPKIKSKLEILSISELNLEFSSFSTFFL